MNSSNVRNFFVKSQCTDLDSAILQFFRHCVSAGEPLNEEVIEAWHDKTGLWIREGYGQTETTLIAATTKEMIIKPGSMGKAAPGMVTLREPGGG